MKSLKERLLDVSKNRNVYEKVYGEKVLKYHEINGEKIPVIKDATDYINEWLELSDKELEKKVIALEKAKKELDDEKEKQAPLLKRKEEYIRIDHLLFEAIAEKESGRPEKMKAYLIEREKIKKKFPKA
tara:strand:- start:1410 stop:1796 length:387 start_codon:yes stop_codon:yes gene_type:complete